MSAPHGRSTTTDRLVALALSVAYTALLVLTARPIGYARDEGFYFQAARAYGRWFELLLADRARALRPDVVDAAWATNHEHPALVKSLFALSNLFFAKRHHVFDLEGTSFRFPAMALSGLLVGVVYAFVARRFGRAAGAVASLGLGFMPAFFHHAHLACFDAPIAAMFAFTAFAYVKTLETRGPSWPIATGVLFGLALDTKHNAWFLPIAGSAHFALTAVAAWRCRAPVIPAIRRSFFALASMAVLGPLVLYALWPWIWHDTRARLEEYVSFHLNHDYYNMEFLGENYWKPPMPRAYAWVMTVATVPTVTLVLATSGLGRRLLTAARALSARDGEGFSGLREDLFLALCLFASYGAWLSTGTPIFGGTKHWMQAYPFLAVFGAAAVEPATTAVRELVARRGPPALLAAVAPVVVVALTIAPVVMSISSLPFGLATYVPLVGGNPGAATLGLNRGFWGYTTADVAPYLNAHAKRGARVYVHDTAWQSWELMVADGIVRRDLVGVGSADEADFILYHHEMHMQGQEYQAWVSAGTIAPVALAGPDGVPVVALYERRRVPRAPAREDD
jgi:4-amino-4-deoxy-L-arabinose transferase-like glycosyltransferase